MTTIAANDLNIEVEESGDKRAPAILLIMGLGMQLTAWPEDFCQGLVDRGFRVVRIDNRDVGLSTKIRRGNAFSLAAAVARALAGAAVSAPYTLHDMADDAVGVMDRLGIERAHIVGASMGGMIAQIIAAEHPRRLRSLVSIMSTSGDPKLPRGNIRVLLPLLLPPSPLFGRARAVRRGMRLFRLIGSPGFPIPEADLRARVERAVARSYYPPGTARQILAIVASGSRSDLLRRIRAPSLVIHGADDPLIPVAGGKDTAAKIPGAELRIIPGMGHDLPPGLIPLLVDAIAEHCQAADRAATPAASRGDEGAAGAKDLRRTGRAR